MQALGHHLYTRLKADFEPPFDFPQVVPLARRPLTPPVWGECAAKVRLACPLAAQGPQYGPAQPRLREGCSTKDLMVIRCAAAVRPARRQLLRSEW